MATNEKPASEAADGAGTPEDGAPGQQIDKIREIIFGGQMRSYEARFSQLDGELTERTRRLGEDLNGRLAQMERDMGEELARLASRLEEQTKLLQARQQADREALEMRLDEDRRKLDERLAADQDRLEQRLTREGGQRDEAHTAAQAALAETERRLSERLSALADEAARETAQLRASIQQNSADFHDALLGLGERLDRALAKAADDLEDVKVSRTDLAALLSEVATRLRREDGGS